MQREGIYIGKRKEGKGTSLLYQYQSIYVLIVYTVYRMHVAEVHCLTDTAILDYYLVSSDFNTAEPD